jgi:hypothetical protein
VLSFQKNGKFSTPLHGSVDSVPIGAEVCGDFRPCQTPSPSAQEMTEIVRHALFTLGPGNKLDFDATALAIDSTHGVMEENSAIP